MIRLIRAILVAFLCSLSMIPALGQVKAGQYANGSFDSKGFDTINLGNLNVMMAIPIINKPGRGGTNFTYTLAYNSAVWYPAYVSGAQTWVNTQNWGWQAQTEVQTGYVSFWQTSSVCGTGSGKFPKIRTDGVAWVAAINLLATCNNQMDFAPEITMGISNAWSRDPIVRYAATAESMRRLQVPC